MINFIISYPKKSGIAFNNSVHPLKSLGICLPQPYGHKWVGPGFSRVGPPPIQEGKHNIISSSS